MFSDENISNRLLKTNNEISRYYQNLEKSDRNNLLLKLLEDQRGEIGGGICEILLRIYCIRNIQYKVGAKYQSSRVFVR